MSDEIKALAKIDYEAGLSVRAIAARYGVSKSAVHEWAKRGGWQRDGDKVPVHIIPGQTGQTDNEDYEAIREATRALLAKARGQIQAGGEDVSARDLRAYTAMLVDLRVVLNAVSPREAEELNLRLDALRRTSTQDSQQVVIRFESTEGAEE